MNTVRSLLLLSAVSVIVSTQLGSGCVSDTSTNDPYYPRDPEPYTRSEPRYEPRYEPARDDRWTSVPLPRDAQLVAEGRDVIRYHARTDGRIYLYDGDGRFVIDDRTLYRDEEYIVATKDNRAWVNKDRVLDYDFEKHHDYRLYFLPRNPAPQDRDNDRRRDADRDAYRQQKQQPAHTGHNAPKPAPGRLVPDTAKLIASGKGVDLSYRAPTNGTAYLYDNDHATLIEIFTMQRGQRLTVSPAKDLAVLDGNTVMNRKDLSTHTTYRLVFDSKP